MPNVLIVGGAGLIGSHVCKAMYNAGFTPIVYDNLSTGHKDSVKWGPLEEADIADIPSLVAVLRQYRPVAVVHLAAKAYVAESSQKPAEYYTENVVKSLFLFNAMRMEGIRNLVFSSSCAIFGPSVEPITESSPKNPISPYGRTKLMVEQILADFDTAYGFPHVNLRYFNAAGADPDGEIGELHIPETHLIPLAIQRAFDQVNPLTINGTQHPTPDGTCVRDFVHVTDLAHAHVLAVERLLDGLGSASYCLGTGAGSSILEVLEAVERQTGLPVPTVEGPARPGDAPSLVADPTLACLELGWKTLYDLSDMVETAVSWQKQVMGMDEI